MRKALPLLLLALVTPARADDYFFDEASNRTVAVSSVAILEALAKVYKADRLLAELTGAR